MNSARDGRDASAAATCALTEALSVSLDSLDSPPDSDTDASLWQTNETVSDESLFTLLELDECLFLSDEDAAFAVSRRSSPMAAVTESDAELLREAIGPPLYDAIVKEFLSDGAGGVARSSLLCRTTESDFLPRVDTVEELSSESESPRSSDESCTSFVSVLACLPVKTKTTTVEATTSTSKTNAAIRADEDDDEEEEEEEEEDEGLLESVAVADRPGPSSPPLDESHGRSPPTTFDSTRKSRSTPASYTQKPCSSSRSPLRKTTSATKTRAITATASLASNGCGHATEKVLSKPPTTTTVTSASLVASLSSAGPSAVSSAMARGGGGVRRGFVILGGGARTRPKKAVRLINPSRSLPSPSAGRAVVNASTAPTRPTFRSESALAENHLT